MRNSLRRKSEKTCISAPLSKCKGMPLKGPVGSIISGVKGILCTVQMSCTSANGVFLKVF